MSTTLLLIHGMGQYVTGWEKEIVDALDTAATGYRKLQAGRFSARVNIVPISYDDVFSAWQEKIGQSAGEVASYIKQHPHEIDSGLANVTDWLQKAGDDSFTWTHIADVVTYRCFPDARAEVQARVMKQIAQAVISAKEAARTANDEAEISLMGHSLGTAVVHDALHRLGSEPFDDGTGADRQFLAENGVLLGNVFMVANVGRILQSQWPVTGATCVRPMSSGPGAYCSQYFNFRHEFDPIPAACPFAPSGWGDGYCAVDDLDHVEHLNVHGWTHYLHHPDVHVRVFRALLADPTVVSEGELAASRRAYGRRPPSVCAGVAANFPQGLTTITRTDQPCTLDGFLESALSYFKIVSAAAAQCGYDVWQLPF